LKGSRIEQALRTKLTQANRTALQEYAQALPEAPAPGEDPAGTAPGGEAQADATQVAGTE
jgi:hypothetical protein